MIRLLKAECGNDYTKVFEAMIQDMALSDIVIREFDAQKVSPIRQVQLLLIQVIFQDEPGLDLSVRVLSRANWSLPPSSNVRLPMMAEDKLNDFKQYYLAKHNQRRLDIRPALGTAELTTSFNGCEKILCVTTFMMIVLMCFNEKAKLSYEVRGLNVKGCLSTAVLGTPGRDGHPREGTEARSPVDGHGQDVAADHLSQGSRRRDR
jgi:cullin-4